MKPISPSPSPNQLAIGAKIRQTRLGQGLTIEQVANSSHLTKGFISRVERDETSPSVASLRTICQVLSLPIGALFEPPKNEIISLDDAPFINMGGTYATEKLLTPRSEARVQIMRSALQPGASGGADFYTINCDIEAVHVLSGQLQMRFPQSNFTLAKGDTMTVAGREPHTWENVTRARTEVIWTIVPAAWSGSSSRQPRHVGP